MSLNREIRKILKEEVSNEIQKKLAKSILKNITGWGYKTYD